MSGLVRLALVASAGLSFSGNVGAQPVPMTSPSVRDPSWPQSYSDLKPDPAIRFGILANGMRYAVMHNATPPRQGSLRLRIGSGSLEESDAEQGLAHFLEHMAFKGSTHVPDGDMIKILERHGLAFGPDTNAGTGQTETVYQLDLPETDSETVSTGLMLLRDIGGELTISPKALEPERGVVLSEERLRDTPDYEANYKQVLAFQLKDQLAARRLPIGKVAVIRSAPASLLRTFYQANYRPDRATLIAVGDFDPAKMEDEIKARFSDWRPVGPETPAPDYGVPERRGPADQLVVRPGATPLIELAWAQPYDETPDTFARERRDIVEQISLAVLNRRLDTLAHETDAPFVFAGASRENESRSAKLTQLRVVFRPEGWRKALQAVIGAQRQALQYGVNREEMDRELTEYRVQLRNAAAGAATRRTPDLANAIAENVDKGDVQTSPAQDLALFERVAGSVTLKDLNTALRNAFQGSGPLLSMTSPEPVDGGEATLASVWHAAEAQPIAAPAAQRPLRWTHTDFGQPGHVVAESSVPDLGLTFVRFANGVRLTIKPTSFRKDQTLVALNFGHGELERTGPRSRAGWAAQAFVPAGLKDLTYQEVQRVLSDKTASLQLQVGDDAFVLEGATRPQDLDVQLQLAAAYMTQPGWRPEAFEQARSGLKIGLARLASTPQGVEMRDLPQLEHSGDPRWHVPSSAEAEVEPISPFKSVLQHALESGPLEVEIVGDVSVAQATAAVAATFGALPARPGEPVALAAAQVRFPDPAPAPVVRSHSGRSDQAVAYVAWPTVDFFSDPQRAREIRLTSEILDSRLVDQVRVAEGATYSPSASSDASETFPGFGYAFASVETPPGKIASFYANVDRIAGEMGAKGVTADELERARKPHMEQLEKAQQTNEYWLLRLRGAQTDSRRLDRVREDIPGYGRMTLGDVQRTAATYFTPQRAWRFEVVPAAVGP